jgi:hypothetical protein
VEVRVRSLVAVVVLVVSSLGPSGCYSTPQPDCAFLCGAGASCPDGYFCAGDGVCKLDGVADSFDCGFVAPPDAGPPVDAPADAPPDAAADAGIDAS